MNQYIRIPGIIKETSAGYILTDIGDELFEKREIYCAGEITQELAYSLTMQLRCLQMQSGDEITMHINSPGGEVPAGLAIYDMMQAVPCRIKTICEGTAASMAAVLFLSGDSRQMFEHAKVMIHDPKIHTCPGGSALMVEQISRQLLKTREEIAKIISGHTGQPLDSVYAATRDETWFSAEECIDWGIADGIITDFGAGAYRQGKRKKNGDDTDEADR